jgi:hypothetical protein
MKKILNLIEAHKQSKCPGSYRKGVVFNKSGEICRMFSLKNNVFKTQEIKKDYVFFYLFINFTTSKLDRHSENFDTIFYAGRGKKDKNKYFVENTDKNPENLKMNQNTTPFPIYVKMKDGYFYLGRYVIGSMRKKKQYNPNLRCNFETLGFICHKI